MIETLPYRWYSDPERLRLEQERVFARSWQYAGRAAEVEEPGSFLAADCAGVPVAVVRDRDGALRAFLNVCRHRGAVLLEVRCAVRIVVDLGQGAAALRPRWARA